MKRFGWLYWLTVVYSGLGYFFISSNYQLHAFSSLIIVILCIALDVKNKKIEELEYAPDFSQPMTEDRKKYIERVSSEALAQARKQWEKEESATNR